MLILEKYNAFERIRCMKINETRAALKHKN